MNTSKAISTISYNSADFLKRRLSEYKNAGILSFWAAIPHLGEDDEAGKKEHFHIYAEPSKRLQTDSLDFIEPDKDNPDKPLKCISWRSSVFSDWYLYVLHDQTYLCQKGLTKKYHYVHSDFITSDSDDLLFLARSINRLAVSPWYAMADAIDNGYSWFEYVKRGTIPIQLVRQYQAGWNALCRVAQVPEFQFAPEINKKNSECEIC